MNYKSCLSALVIMASPTALLAQDNQEKIYDLDPYEVKGGILTGLTDTDAFTSLERELLQNTQGTTAVDIFNFISGVTGVNEGGRQSFRINVRGLEGSGRVAIDIDGAQQNLTDHNHGFATNRMSIDTSLIKSVDVVRGPASNKKGGGALAGSVSFRTINPSDLLLDPEANYGGLLNFGGESNGSGYTATAAGAVKFSDQWSSLGAFSVREYGDYEDGEGQEVIASGSQIKTALFKLAWEGEGDQSFIASYNGSRENFDGSGAFARGQLRSSNVQKEEINTDTFTINYQNIAVENDWLELYANAYITQKERIEEDLDSDDVDIHDIETVGGSISNLSTFSSDSISNEFSYGFDYYKDDLVSTSNGDIPLSSDPAGERSQFGVFLNGIHQLSEGLTLFDGIRYDRFKMNNKAEHELTGNQVTGRVGVEFRPFASSENWNDFTLFTSWGTGFRTPTLREAFIQSEPREGRRGFSPGTLPNPELKPETSSTWEIGLQRDTQGWLHPEDAVRLRIAYYDQKLEDVIGTVPSADPNYNELDNIGEDGVRGIEIEVRYVIKNVFAGFTFDKRERDQVGTGLPGDPIQNHPWSLFSTLGANFLDNKLTVGVEHRQVGQFEQSETNQTNPTVIDRLIRPSYHLINLYAQYHIQDGLKLSLRVDNTFDKFYQAYQTVDAGMGRNYKASLEFRF